MASEKVFPKTSATFVAWIIMGLTATNLWFNLVGYSPAFSSGLDFASVSSLGRLGFMAACIVIPALLGAFDRPLASVRHVVALLIPALLFMGTGMFGLAGNQSLIDPHVLVLAGSVLMGLGYTWSILNFYALQSSSGTLWQVVVAFVVSGMLAAAVRLAVINMAAVSVQIGITIALTVAIPFCLYGASRRALQSGIDAGTGFPFRLSAHSTRSGDHRNSTGKRRIFTEDRGQIVLLAIVTIAMIALRGLGDGGVWGGDRIKDLSSISPIVLGLALYGILSLTTFWMYLHHQRQRRYHLPFLVLIGGFILQVALGEAGGQGLLAEVIAPSLAIAIELFCQVIFSFTIVASIRTLPLSPPRVAGFTLAFSWVLALLWMLVFENTGATASLVILMVSYLVIIFIAVPRERGLAPEGKETGNPFDAIITQSRTLALAYGLTNRESEILEQLAQGRSVPYICEELTVAEGTIRTHMMHIYKKLNVHSRQELLDLVAGKKR